MEDSYNQNDEEFKKLNNLNMKQTKKKKKKRLRKKIKDPNIK